MREFVNADLTVGDCAIESVNNPVGRQFRGRNPLGQARCRDTRDKGGISHSSANPRECCLFPGASMHGPHRSVGQCWPAVMSDLYMEGFRCKEVEVVYLQWLVCFREFVMTVLSRNQ